MKSSLIIFATLSIVSVAQASKLECKSRDRSTTPSQSEIHLKAQIVSATELRNIVVISNESNFAPESVGIGRQSVCSASSNYNPRKFISSNQFILELKADKKNQFGSAVMECQFILMIPKNISSLPVDSSITIPSLVHCDQNGGREDLNCKITN